MISEMKMQRIKKGLTQVDVWMTTGVPQWRISLIERGIPPKAEEAKKIASALEMEEIELFPNTSGLSQANVLKDLKKNA